MQESFHQIDHIFGESLGKLITQGTEMKLICENLETDFYPEDNAMFGKFQLIPNIEDAIFLGKYDLFNPFRPGCTRLGW